MMKFAASNGMTFQLDILGYEFPHIENDRWDSNWLIIEVSVIHPRGNWKASHPSLTTFEIMQLANWLENIGTTKIDTNVSFTEPNLQFLLLKTFDESQSLRISFQSELRPPWSKSNRADQGDMWVEFPLAEIDTKAAAQDLRQQLEQYPPRGPT